MARIFFFETLEYIFINIYSHDYDRAKVLVGHTRLHPIECEV